jgi:hypothetical protein
MYEIQNFGFKEAPDFLVPNMRPGLGLLHSTGLDGYTSVGHGGNLIHYHSDMAFDPDSGIGVFVSTNSITGMGIERVLSNAILETAVYEKTGTLIVPTPDETVSMISLTAEELQAYAGIYAIVSANDFAQIAVSDEGALYILNFSGIPFPLNLIPLSDGSFICFISPDAVLRFWFEEMGGELALFMGDYKTHLVGARLEVENYKPVESFVKLMGLYAAVLDEGHVSIASHVEVGVDENGITYIRMYALHGMSPISPIVYIDDLTYSDGALIEFRIDGDDIYVAFAGATFAKIS